MISHLFVTCLDSNCMTCFVLCGDSIALMIELCVDWFAPNRALRKGLSTWKPNHIQFWIIQGKIWVHRTTRDSTKATLSHHSFCLHGSWVKWFYYTKYYLDIPKIHWTYLFFHTELQKHFCHAFLPKYGKFPVRHFYKFKILIDDSPRTPVVSSLLG